MRQSTTHSIGTTSADPTVVLSTTGDGALQCLFCVDAQCSTEESSFCGLNMMCFTASILESSSGDSANVTISKGCGLANLCPTPGNRTFSDNNGSVISARCCDTDNCNSENITAPRVSSQLQPEGLQCYTCFPANQCNSILQCRAEEDMCFRENVTFDSVTYETAGCTSSNLCQASPNPGTQPTTQSLTFMRGEPECCNTSLCNFISTPVRPTNQPPSFATSSTSPATNNITGTPLPMTSSEATTSGPRSSAYLGMQLKLTSIESLSDASVTEIIDQYFAQVLGDIPHAVNVRKIQRM
ncbi:ly6/PLAUR domain-containing protein 3-like [Salarias fasciatus]|nr:ly6/PLAUR domain-containing protein 3-like [Salarias fasciatus]